MGDNLSPLGKKMIDIDKDTIYVYSDASTNNGIGTAVSIIMTATEYLGIKGKKYKVDGPSATEICGVIQSLETIKKDYRLRQKPIEIYTDLESTPDTYEKLKSGEETLETVVYPNLWKQLLSLAEGLDISMYHMNGHQLGTNPNVVCDIIAGIIRRL